MKGAIGLVVAVVGVLLVIYGVAMFTNFRGVSTWYWESALRWQRRWIPYLRNSPTQLDARSWWLRGFGGFLLTTIGVGWILFGVGLSVGYLR